jgi:hypothetical protein
MRIQTTRYSRLRRLGATRNQEPAARNDRNSDRPIETLQARTQILLCAQNAHRNAEPSDTKTCYEPDDPQEQIITRKQQVQPTQEPLHGIKLARFADRRFNEPFSSSSQAR